MRLLNRLKAPKRHTLLLLGMLVVGGVAMQVGVQQHAKQYRRRPNVRGSRNSVRGSRNSVRGSRNSFGGGRRGYTVDNRRSQKVADRRRQKLKLHFNSFKAIVDSQLSLPKHDRRMPFQQDYKWTDYSILVNEEDREREIGLEELKAYDTFRKKERSEKFQRTIDGENCKVSRFVEDEYNDGSAYLSDTLKGKKNRVTRLLWERLFWKHCEENMKANGSINTEEKILTKELYKMFEGKDHLKLPEQDSFFRTRRNVKDLKQVPNVFGDGKSCLDKLIHDPSYLNRLEKNPKFLEAMENPQFADAFMEIRQKAEEMIKKAEAELIRIAADKAALKQRIAERKLIQGEQPSRMVSAIRATKSLIRDVTPRLARGMARGTANLLCGITKKVIEIPIALGVIVSGYMVYREVEKMKRSTEKLNKAIDDYRRRHPNSWW